MTKIEWTAPPGYKGETWNPTVGCERVSEGCRFCYAERMAVRLGNMGVPEYAGLTNGDLRKPRWTGVVRELPERLALPLRRRAPTCWFVDSMSDLFHEDVSDEFIAAVFGVMAATPQHRYIILTKRAERLPRWFAWVERRAEAAGAMFSADDHGWRRGHILSAAAQRHGVAGGGRGGRPPGVLATDSDVWPLPNVILGVSVEDQETADERIPHLLQTPAACRMVSYEPALGAVDLGLQSATCDCCQRWPSRWAVLPRPVQADPLIRMLDPAARDMVALPGVHRLESNQHGALSALTPMGPLGNLPSEMRLLPGLDWAVVGGESGPGARPFDPLWAHSAVAQCSVAGVPVFVKQMGSRPVGMILRDGKGGDPYEWPESLRVRQWPAVLMDRQPAETEVQP